MITIYSEVRVRIIQIAEYLCADAYIERANGNTVELVAVCADVADIEVIREVLSRCREALSTGLRALDEDGGTTLCGEGLDTVLEERSDH